MCATKIRADGNVNCLGKLQGRSSRTGTDLFQLGKKYYVLEIIPPSRNRKFNC